MSPLFSLYITHVIIQSDANGKPHLYVQTRFRNDVKSNGSYRGRLVNMTDPKHHQHISLKAFNVILHANHKPQLTIPMLSQLASKNPVIVNESDNLGFDARINGQSDQFDESSIQASKDTFNFNSQVTGPFREKLLALPPMERERILEAYYKQRLQENRVATSLAAVNGHDPMAAQISMNSTVSLADSIAHSPTHLNVKEQRKEYELSVAADEYATPAERHVLSKLDNIKQTKAIQKQINEIRYKALQRSKEEPSAWDAPDRSD